MSLAVVAVVVVVAIDWSLGMGPIRAAQSWSAAAGCDSPDYYSSGGGYDSHLLGQRASVTYTARGDAEDIRLCGDDSYEWIGLNLAGAHVSHARSATVRLSIATHPSGYNGPVDPAGNTAATRTTHLGRG